MNLFDSLTIPYRIIHESRQRLMKIPTDPKEIHRRANIIRDRLKAEKRLAKLESIERELIKEDLHLIRFDQVMRDN